jgi:hypothetical protein
MSQGDTGQPASGVELGGQGRDVRGQGRSRVDDPGRIVTHDPGVRAREGERTRVLSPDPNHIRA